MYLEAETIKQPIDEVNMYTENQLYSDETTNDSGTEMFSTGFDLNKNTQNKTTYIVSFQKQDNWEQKTFETLQQANQFADHIEQQGCYVEVEVCLV